MISTAVRRLCGHPDTGPRGDAPQSCSRMRTRMSPSPARNPSLFPGAAPGGRDRACIRNVTSRLRSHRRSRTVELTRQPDYDRSRRRRGLPDSLMKHTAALSRVCEGMTGGDRNGQALAEADALSRATRRASSSGAAGVLCRVILAADVLQVDRRLRVGELQTLQMLEEDPADRQVAKPLVVRRDDEPGRVLRTAT